MVLPREARSEARRRCASPFLALACAALMLLAGAERRLWKSDFNRSDVSSVKNGETGKVITSSPRRSGVRSSGSAVTADFRRTG
jgi:hypothetical protein